MNISRINYHYYLNLRFVHIDIFFFNNKLFIKYWISISISLRECRLLLFKNKPHRF